MRFCFPFRRSLSLFLFSSSRLVLLGSRRAAVYVAYNEPMSRKFLSISTSNTDGCKTFMLYDVCVWGMCGSGSWRWCVPSQTPCRSIPHELNMIPTARHCEWQSNEHEMERIKGNKTCLQQLRGKRNQIETNG
eukprot:gene1295-745_t